MMDYSTVLKVTVIFWFVLSCKEKLIKPPEDLIPQSEMTDILYDLALIKGIESTNTTLMDKYHVETMPYLYEKYGIDSLRFVKSDAYYASTPAVYQNMYNTILSRLEDKSDVIDEQRQQRKDSVRSRSERVRDSLKQKIKPTGSPSPSKK